MRGNGLGLAGLLFALAAGPLSALAAVQDSLPKPPRPAPAPATEPTKEPEYAGTLRGRVLDAEGNPVGAGVRVRAGPAEPTCLIGAAGESASAPTSEDGTFVLGKLKEMEFNVFARRGNGEKLEGAAAFRIPEGSTGIVLRFAPVDERTVSTALDREPSPHEPAATAITGRLVLTEGPDRAHTLAIIGVPESGGIERRFRPSRKGVFDTGTLSAGRWNFRIVAPNDLVVGEAREVAAGSRGLDVRIAQHGVVRGKVLLPDGDSAGPGATVWARALGDDDRERPGRTASTMTNEDGTFVLEYLGDFRFGVEARKGTPDLVEGPTALDVRPGAKDVILRLARRSSVKGVLLAADGTPAPAHRLEACRADYLRPWEVTSGKDGVFEFPELPPGGIRIIFRWGGKVIDLGEPEAPATDVVLRLPAK